jgi:EAL domain-containing protein (putative c-di-GMP-specific phosphodiesterase class I)
VRVAVNLSAKQFKDENLTQIVVSRSLARYGPADPSCWNWS